MMGKRREARQRGLAAYRCCWESNRGATKRWDFARYFDPGPFDPLTRPYQRSRARPVNGYGSVMFPLICRCSGFAFEYRCGVSQPSSIRRFPAT